ncbi:MAG: TonB-dependent receptor [Hyphomonadaceae bacterium]|nr:TonB-dependent receptor [Hyphomonadaceae bacterium]
MNSRLFKLLAGAAVLAQAPVFAGVASAQSAVAAIEEEIVVTARKRGGAEDVQDVPLAVTAFGTAQLEALNFRDVSSLSYTMPNVQLEDNGTSPGYANFSIRGLGINSSIPSIDPTVGVFVDGVYMGTPAGLVLDNFDLEGIEVLRGPQGVLFGRNVTGGAVIIRTTTPTDTFHVNAGASVETGLNYTADASVSGPIVEGVLQGKLAVYYNNDEGYFEYNGNDFGAQEMTVLRPALRWTPDENSEFLLRLEYGEIDADGPVSQNHDAFDRDSDDFAIDNVGYVRADWRSASLEHNLDISFGEGTLTNILAYRKYQADNLSDIDGQDASFFDGSAYTDQEQFSYEGRYAGTFGALSLTTGVYYFTQDLTYLENRHLGEDSALLDLLGFPDGFDVSGGGKGQFSTWGVFANGDYELTEQLTLNVGVRYTHEEKEVEISTLRGTIPALLGPSTIDGADLVAHRLYPEFFSDDSWNDISPRVGLQWAPSEDTQFYTYWAQGFRSGGYNFRQSIALNTVGPAGPTVPGPFDEEEQTTIEVGVKHDFLDGRGRINAAVYHNTIENLQRELNLLGSLGPNQQIVNAADATIQGAEIEARFALTETFLIQAQLGYTDGQYDDIFVDISSTGSAPFVIDQTDYDLAIPRLSEWTYGVSFIHDLDTQWGGLSSRLSYSHRDENFFTDNNLGFFPSVDLVDVNFTFRPTNTDIALSLYGDNLGDETTYGGDTILTDTTGGNINPNARATFSPLNKGRVIGFRVRYDF